MEAIARCPLCASTSRARFDSRESHGERIQNWICRGCGLVFMSPRRTPEELAAFYQRGYRTAQQGREEPTPDKLRFEERRAEGQLAMFRQGAESIQDFLEVGCGGGRLMRLVEERLGARAVGIEPGAAYRDFLRREGLTVYVSLDALLEREPEQRFDLISLSHVLEHLPDPVAYLTRLRMALLKPTGRIYVEVPNLLAHTSFEPGHLYSFTALTLRRTVEAAGFGVTFLELHARPRKRDPRPHYISMIIAPAEGRRSLAVLPKPPAPAVIFMRRLVGRNGLDHPLWFLRNRAARTVAWLRTRGAPPVEAAGDH
jgi:SAM-dependent methyltransferase